MMLRSILVLLFILPIFSARGQSMIDPLPAFPALVFSPKADSQRYEALLATYGHRKKLPKGFEIQALVALSHYPALKHVRVKFVFRKKKIAHLSQPDILSMLNPFSKRKYKVIISKQLRPDLVPTMLQSLPYNAQIGVLGHELAHTVSYLDGGIFKLIGMGMKYGNEEYKTDFEQSTDRRTIDYGLGHQLLAWTRATYSYRVKDGRGKFYLSPEAIEGILKIHPLYE